MNIVYSEISSAEEEQKVRDWCKEHKANVDEFGRSSFILIDPDTFQPYVKIDEKNYLLLPLKD